MGKAKDTTTRKQLMSNRQTRMLALCVVLSTVWVGLTESIEMKELLPIKHVRIAGDFEYLQRESVESVVRPLLEKGFFELDLHEAGDAVGSLPWVSSVSLKKVWPDTLEIDIQEQRAYMKWGKNGYLNRNGEPFHPQGKQVETSLPEIFGPEGQEKQLMAQFEKISAELTQLGMTAERLHVSDRRSWVLELANGLQIQLGRDRPNIAFERFLNSVPLLGDERLADVERIDMRYPNGFAVKWKQV